jgi:hypothetical protein
MNQLDMLVAASRIVLLQVEVIGCLRLDGTAVKWKSGVERSCRLTWALAT